MTTSPTPVPAASERMTAEQVVNHRRSVLGNINNRKARGLGPGGYATELALLDTIQSLERELSDLKDELVQTKGEHLEAEARIDELVALLPKPDRAKADEEVKEAVTYLQSWATIQDSPGLDDVARRTREVASLIEGQ